MGRRKADIRLEGDNPRFFEIDSIIKTFVKNMKGKQMTSADREFLQHLQKEKWKEFKKTDWKEK